MHSSPVQKERFTCPDVLPAGFTSEPRRRKRRRSLRDPDRLTPHPAEENISIRYVMGIYNGHIYASGARGKVASFGDALDPREAR